MPSNKRKGTTRYGNIHAQIPVEVLESAAYCAMPDYAVRVLVALASEYRGPNNGDLSLPLSMAKQQGINTQWKLSTGIALLEQTGLIERMRVPKICGGKGVAGLYALGWREINPSSKYDQPLSMPKKPPNRWAKWIQPANWKDIEKRFKYKAQGKRSGAVSTRVEIIDTPGCTEEGQVPSTRVCEIHRIVDTPGWVPSRSGSGGGGRWGAEVGRQGEPSGAGSATAEARLPCEL